MVEIAGADADPDRLGPLQGPAAAVQVRHDGRLLPALPHGAVPHHAQGADGASAAPMPTPSSRATCCARSRPAPPRTPTTAACWCCSLKMVAQGKGGDYKIADPRRLREAARVLRASRPDGRDDLEIAGDLADLFMAEFAWSEEPNATLKLAPEKRQALWKKLEIEPHGHRLRGGRVHAPHAHGRGPRLPQPPHGRAEVQPGRRLGRLDDRHRWSPTSSSARRSRSAAA